MNDTRPSRRLEAFAAFCLGAPADDFRLGDLSELHVRTETLVRSRLDGVPGGAVVARLAADARYIAALADVLAFARGVDPGVQLYENGVGALAALEVREKTVAIFQFAVRRFALPALLLACSAMMLNNAIDVWNGWRHTASLMAGAQRDKAETAARGLTFLNSEFERVVGWAAYWIVRQPVDERRNDYVRLLLQQEPALLQIIELDRQGRERLVMNRYSKDVIGSDADRSADEAFVAIRKDGRYLKIHADQNGEPVFTVGLAPRGAAAGVIVAEISLKPARDIISAVAPEGGSAYLVDREGRLLFANAKSADAPVRSVSADVPGSRWKVVVDVPSAVYDTPERNAAIRAFATAGLALVAAALALMLALRPTVPARKVVA